jgi:deoxyribose-phosphate aldolase
MSNVKARLKDALHISRGDPAPGHVERNPGTDLELDWVLEQRVNRSAVERRAETIGKRRTVKKEWQAAWLLKAITLMDLTTLSGDDTASNVRRLCAKARQPVRQDLLESLGASDLPIRPARSACITRGSPPPSRRFVAPTIPVAAVSTGFPAGLSPFKQRVEEIRASVAEGAS